MSESRAVVAEFGGAGRQPREMFSDTAAMGRYHLSRTDGGARSLVGQLDYELGST